MLTKPMLILCGVAILPGGLPVMADAVVHDTSAEFAGGTFSGTEDVGSGASPSIENTCALPFNWGSGAQGSKAVSGTEIVNTYRSCSGSASNGYVSVTAGDESAFAAGDVVLIHHSRGSSLNSGRWEVNKVVSTASGQINLQNLLLNDYADSGADQSQIVKVPQYTSLTVGGGTVLTASAWDGNTGGIVAVMCSGTATVAGAISGTGKGFRGGAGGAAGTANDGSQGEGYEGTGIVSGAANYSGGGGGGGTAQGENAWASSGGGGGLASAGAWGQQTYQGDPPGEGGGTAGEIRIYDAVFGGGGGGAGARKDYDAAGGAGGSGGGLVFVVARSLTVTGSIASNGANGGATTVGGSGGGGGAGGNVIIQAETATLGTGLVTATAGAGGGGNNVGGVGGVGRTRIEYRPAGLSGTANPGAWTAEVPYRATGTYRSAAINVTGSTTFGTLDWAATGSVRLRTRTSADGVAWGSWSDWLATSGEAIPSSVNNYIQYEAELEGSAAASPSLTSVTVHHNVPSVPGDRRPADRTAIQTTQPLLLWSPSTDPQSQTLYYSMTIDDDAALASPFVNDAATGNGGQEAWYSYSGGSIVNGGTYYWRIKVTDGSDVTWSPIYRFSVNTSLPATAAALRDTSSDFAEGTFMSAQDAGSGASPAIETAYDLGNGAVDWGSGVDGATILYGLQMVNVYRSCSGTAGNTYVTLAAGDESAFGADDVVLIHHTRGTTSNTGGWEVKQVTSTSSGQVNLGTVLSNSYADSGADQSQIIRLPQYTTVEVPAGALVEPKPWDGNTGGVLAFLCSGDLTIGGDVSTIGKGYRGGLGGAAGTSNNAYQGESVNGMGVVSAAANANAGGGGDGTTTSEDAWASSGGGGGLGTAGQNGRQDYKGGPGGTAGSAAGTASLTQAVLGGGGGGAGARQQFSAKGGMGGNGAGLALLLARETTVTGTLRANGGTGEKGPFGGSGGGGGAGGSIMLKATTAAIGSSLVSATGGAGGTGNNAGGTGGVGRIRVEHAADGLTGTTSPSASAQALSRKTLGTYLSAPIEITGCSSFDSLDWTVTGGAGTSVRLRTRTSSDGESWSAWSGWLTSSGSTITSAADDFIQFEAELTGTTSATPALSSVSVNYDSVVPPTITDQPEPQHVCPTATASFTVAATDGGGVLGYQWQKDTNNLADGGGISGATAATLQITGVDAGDAGSYRCIVSNEAGQVISDAVALTVNAAPVIAQAPGPIALSVATSSDCPLVDNQIDLSAGDADNDTLSWSLKAGSGPTMGTVSFVGGDTGPAVTVCYDPAPSASGPDSFIIQVSDGCVANTAEIQIAPTVSDRPLIVQWRSVRTHSGGAGSLALVLSPTGVTSESRRDGVQRIEIEFTEAVEADDGSLGVNDVSVTNSAAQPRTPATVVLAGAGKIVRIDFAPGTLSNQDRYTVDVSGMFRSAGTGLLMTGDGNCSVRCLTSDVNGDGTVDLIDVGAVKGQNRQPVTAANAHLDINGDGKINLIDAAMAKAMYGLSAP